MFVTPYFCVFQDVDFAMVLFVDSLLACFKMLANFQVFLGLCYLSMYSVWFNKYMFCMQAAVKEERREARRAKKEMKELYRCEAQRAQKVAAISCPSSIRLM